MSNKQSLPLLLEPEWQGQHSCLPLFKTDPYRQPSVDNRNGPVVRGTRLTTSNRHQVQSRDFEGESLAHDTMRGIKHANAHRSGLVPTLYGNTNMGSELLYTIGRYRSRKAPCPNPPLIEGRNRYGSRGHQSRGHEMSQPNRDNEEQSSSWDACFVIGEDSTVDIARGSPHYHQAVTKHLASRRTMKRLRYSQGLRTRAHKLKIIWHVVKY